MSATKLAFATGMMLLTAGCGYQPLKAPCAADEGNSPLAYAAPAKPIEPLETLDRCGPMRPI